MFSQPFKQFQFFSLLLSHPDSRIEKSPVSPFDWLQGLPKFSAFVQQPPRAFATTTFPRRLGREDSFRCIFKYFYERLSSSLSGSNHRAPLFVVSGAPGCGKSYFLDELGARRAEDIAEYGPPELQPLLLGAVTIKLSFNGWSSVVDFCDSGDSARLGLCARVLFGCVLAIWF